MGKIRRDSLKWPSMVVLLLIVMICLLTPQARETLRQIFSVLTSMDVEQVVNYIRSYGHWAAVISFCLMILQAVVAPIPAFLITFANATIFGWWQGAILSWSSAVAGASVCFYVARILGRDATEHLASKTALKGADAFFARYGKHAVLICRLLPFVSFDLVSYAAGLTKMGFWSLFIATGIGQLPATVIYSYVGGMLSGGARLFVTALMILFALTVFIGMIKKIYNDRHERRQSEFPSEERGFEA